MEQIPSPDIPAYFCYSLVIVVGLVVAFSKVNQLMSSSPARWGFLGTWLVFAAYALVPVLLFWFLDYSGALHDTSLFAALIVAIGYRQILAGESKGIIIPGQISSMWSPIEAWAYAVRDGIVTKSKLYSDRFSEKVRSFLAAEADRVERLAELALTIGTDQTQLLADLKTIETMPADGMTEEALTRIRLRRRADRCLQSIRMVYPEDYGFWLKDRKLIDYWQYQQWLGNLGANVMQVVGWLVVGLILTSMVLFFFSGSVRMDYNRWRFGKTNATDLDRYRSHVFMAKLLADSDPKLRDEVLGELLAVLRYRSLNGPLGDETLKLYIEFRRPQIDLIAMPLLIDALHTENPDMRTRIHQAIEDIRQLDYKSVPIDADVTTVAPAKSETAAQIETKVRKYRKWWEEASGAHEPKVKASPGPAPPAPVQAATPAVP